MTGLVKSSNTSGPIIESIKDVSHSQRGDVSTSAQGDGQTTVSQPHQSGRSLLTPSDFNHAKDVIAEAVKTISGVENDRRILLLLDQPDISLATSSPSGPVSRFNSLVANVTALARSVHTTIISTSADSPLMRPATTALNEGDDATPSSFPQLEIQHAALVTSMAHQAKYILQTRRLDTGWASDVSGVLRINRGSNIDDEGGAKDPDEPQEKELLYHIKGDGSVRVFERGSYAAS